ARIGGADAIVPRWEGDVEPLHAIYAARCLAAMEASLRAGRYALRDFLGTIRVDYVSEAELRRVCGAAASLTNVTTPEQLAAVGGVLGAGESFDEGARREAREELGVALEPEPLFPFRWADEQTVVHGMVYRARHDGPFRLQPEEIVHGEFLALDAVAARAGREPFCPDGLAALAEYRRRWPAGTNEARRLVP